MVFEASDYAIWMVFTFLEVLAIRFSRNKPELQPIRNLMALCLIRDFILLAWSCHLKYFWASYWISQQLELIGLALIAGMLIGKTRPWRFPAFTLAVMCVHYAFQGWPITCLPEEIFHFERNCCLIIFGTLLVGGIFIWSKNQLPIACSVAILALSDMLSAQSFLMGGYSPRMASVVWVLGLLSILVAASRVAPEPRRNKSGETQAAAASRTDMHSPRELARLLVATPTFDASQTQEWLLLPCRTQIQ